MIQLRIYNLWSEAPMLEEMFGQIVVVDMKSTFVCLGKLVRADDRYLEIHDADLHDLRDTRTTRENYVVASRETGVKRNRKRVLVASSEVVAVARRGEGGGGWIGAPGDEPLTSALRTPARPRWSNAPPSPRSA